MYWPDYRIHSQGKPRWGLALFLGLLLGLLGATLLLGWWRMLLPSVGAAGVSVESTLPAPLALQGTPQLVTEDGVELIPTVGAAQEEIAGSEKVVPGEPAPAFTLPDLLQKKTTYTLASYRGQPVILNFWASWCVPCRREMPALQATAARYEVDGLLLIGMNQTYIDDLAASRAFVQELELSFPNTRDDTGAVGAEAYQVAGIPTTVFIDREGTVVHIQIGEMSPEQITDYTQRLISGRPWPP